MSKLKFSENQIMTENPFIDLLIYNLKILAYATIIKDNVTADLNETVESLKNSGLYIACVEKRAELALFPTIPDSFLTEVGVPQVYIDRYKANDDVNYIPDQYHENLVKLLSDDYLLHYDELNEYYRMITGLPPHGDPGVPIRDYDYLIPEYITYEEEYFHEVGYQLNKTFEELGVLDVVRAEYPEYKYLNYLTQGITIYEARKKLDFQILWMPENSTKELNINLKEEFERKYNENRNYVLQGVYSTAYEIDSEYYHSFMMAYTMIATIDRKSVV